MPSDLCVGAEEDIRYLSTKLLTSPMLDATELMFVALATAAFIFDALETAAFILLALFATALTFVILLFTALTFAILLPTLFTFAIDPATVFISDTVSFKSSATVTISAMFAPQALIELLPEPESIASLTNPLSSTYVT